MSWNAVETVRRRLGMRTVRVTPSVYRCATCSPTPSHTAASSW